MCITDTDILRVLHFLAFILLPSIMAFIRGYTAGVILYVIIYTTVFMVAPVTIALLWGQDVGPGWPWVVENSTLMRRLGLKGLAMWPVVFIEGAALTEKGNPTVVLRHESIHIAQQLELGVLPFYIIYMTEQSCRALMNGWGYDQAYMQVSFEREAYANECKSVAYLRRRRYCAWVWYMCGE